MNHSNRYYKSASSLSSLITPWWPGKRLILSPVTDELLLSAFNLKIARLTNFLLLVAGKTYKVWEDVSVNSFPLYSYCVLGNCLARFRCHLRFLFILLNPSTSQLPMARLIASLPHQFVLRHSFKTTFKLDSRLFTLIIVY